MLGLGFFGLVCLSSVSFIYGKGRRINCLYDKSIEIFSLA